MPGGAVDAAAGEDRHALVVPRLLFPLLALLWLLPRFFGPAGGAPGAVVRAVDAVRAGPSPATGRFEAGGLPDPAEDPAGLLRRPGPAAARAALLSRIDAANEELARQAARISGRVEVFPDGVAALRMAGLLVPFRDGDAGRLADFRRHALTRPWEALGTLVEVVEARLEEPPEGLMIEDSVRRRELTRVYREAGDAMRDQERAVEDAVAAFREDVLGDVARAEGPFRRRGRGRIAEILLAALLGASLREALRRRPGRRGWAIPLSFAPVLALGAILPAEGSSVLPVDPVAGLSLAFLPLAFSIGFATSGVLALASRIERLFEPEREGAAPARAPSPASARPVTPERPPEPEPPLPPARPAAPPRTEREVPEDPAMRRPPRAERPPREPARPERPRRDDPPPPERLPFFRRR